MNYEEVVFDFGTNEQKNKIIHLFKMAIRLFENNIRNEGFAKSVFLYDYEFLSSYLKTLYNNAREIIKKINDKTNTFVNVLYSIKDLMTKKFVGFDRKGIFCSDSHGEPLPLVALITHPTEGEILMESTINGMVWEATEGMHQALYIKYKK